MLGSYSARTSRCRRTCALMMWAALCCAVLAPLRSVLAQQSTVDLATLETRQPDVQWSPAGAARWVSVPDRQAVAPGDRVRTGPGAAARLVYFEGTVTEVGAETGVLIQRLERGSGGNVITNLFQ